MLPGRLRLALAAVIAIGLITAAGCALEAHRLTGPVEATSGIITRLDVHQRRRSTRAEFLLASGREFDWYCNLPSCGPSVQALKSLEWETPMPADLQFVGSQLVGLTIREAEVIEADREIARSIDANRMGAILSAGFALAAAVGLHLGRDRHKLRPSRRSTRRISS